MSRAFPSLLFWSLVLTISITVAACSTTVEVPTPTAPVRAPTAAPSARPHAATPAVQATLPPATIPVFPSATAAPSSSSPSAALRLPATIVEVARGFGGPDDLALMDDGSILFSDTSNGSVSRIDSNGKLTTPLRGLEEPEGIVVLPDGSLLIAEQKKNRLVHFDPAASPPLTPWLQLENTTGSAGVDGIARDPATGDILIPDSPNGRVLRVNAAGKDLRTVAAGFVRPTGIALAPDGSLVVADEFGNRVQRILPDGKVETLGQFATPDDVAVDSAGRIFVASLGDDSLRMIDPTSGSIELIATLRGPQGLVLDRAGNLLATEFALNRIVRVRIR